MMTRYMHWWFDTNKRRRDDRDLMLDFLDGKAFKDVFEPVFGDSPNNVAGVTCFDGVQVRKRGPSRSLTVIMLKFLTLPPWLQTKRGFMFFWGIAPPCGKVQIYLRFLAEQCREISEHAVEV